MHVTNDMHREKRFSVHVVPVGERMSSTVPAGYKLTEVGVIPEEWEVRTVGSVIDRLEAGVSVNSVDEGQRIYPHEQSILKTSSVANGQFLAHEAKKIAPRDIPRAKLNPRADTIIISRMNTPELVGECGYVERDFHALFLPDRLWMTKSSQSSELCVKWLAYLLASEEYKRRIKESATGTSGSMKNLSKSVFLSLPIPFPSDKEQRAIAAALADVDALLARLDQLIAKKRDLKQAAMQQLLTGQHRLPGFSGEWEVKRLEEVASIQRGASPRPIDNPIWFDENSSVGWVRISDVSRSVIYLRETTQRLSTQGVLHSRPVSRGSLIMSICATVGRPVITEIDTCIHDGFVVFDNLRIEKNFLYYVLKFIESNWTKHGQTGSQMNLNTGLINQTEITLPSAKEQTAIAAVLSDMDAEITALEGRRDKTRALKQGMMQELLTGRIRLG
jgi:type I restriction enzyme S subunit